MKSIYAHTPWLRQSEFLPYLVENRINPELYLSPEPFEGITPADLKELRQTLEDNGLSCSMHAPFNGMDPGSTDRKTVELTNLRVSQTLRLAEQLNPKVIVFHTGYHRKLTCRKLERWMEVSISFWRDWLPHIKNRQSIVALENIFEQEPSIIRNIIDGLNDPMIRHCFDIGHFNICGEVSLEEWFSELGSCCVECHIHDNKGKYDSHLPVGEGTVDFKLLQKMLDSYAPDSIWTLEAHRLEKLKRSHTVLKSMIQNLELESGINKTMLL